MEGIRAVRSAFTVEALGIVRSPAFVALTLVAGVNFLIGMSLFGLTGSHAPTAIVNQGGGPDVKVLERSLERAHRSFTLIPMSASEAKSRLANGTLVAEIIIPRGFSRAVGLDDGQLTVAIDNVNTDQTEDVERAIPSAILFFGKALHLPGSRLSVHEHDLLAHDTDYIPYLTVSSLALVALVMGAILAALSVTREFERTPEPTWTISRLAPAPPWMVLLGKAGAASLAGFAATAIPLGVVALGYGVWPGDWVLLVPSLLLAVIVSVCLGLLAGALLRRTAAVAPLVFGVGMPLYVVSGALEPVRFDGNGLWIAAHAVPTYYSIALLESAYHGLQVTPEPLWLDAVALIGFAIVTFLLAERALRRPMRTA